MKVKNALISLCALIALLAILVGIGRAQGKMRTAEEMVVKMKQEVNLTDEQVKQITPVIQGEIQKRKELMEQMRTLHRETENKLDQYLTPEQKAQWKDLQEQRKANRPFRYGGNFGGHTPGGGGRGK